MFKINDYIFYGSGGICRVENICEEPFEGAPKGVCYYVLHTLSEPKQVIWNPVQNDKVLMRPVMTKSDCDALLSSLSSLSPFVGDSAKVLREQYINAIKSGHPSSWGRILVTVKARERAAEAKLVRVTDAEHNFFDNAKRLIVNELALAKGISLADAEELLLFYLP